MDTVYVITSLLIFLFRRRRRHRSPFDTIVVMKNCLKDFLKKNCSEQVLQL